MSQWNETSFSLHVENTKHTKKKFFLIGCISSPLDFFSITKKLKKLTLRDNFLINEIGNAQFYRKLKYANLVERNSILTLSHRAVTRSWSLFLHFLQVLFSSWCSVRKVQLCFLGNLAFHLQNYRIQQKLNETHKICLWLEQIRSLHKEFAYLLYNSKVNTWNSQNLAT